jgi:hypothetical protein
MIADPRGNRWLVPAVLITCLTWMLTAGGGASALAQLPAIRLDQQATVSQTNPDYIFFEAEWFDKSRSDDANLIWRPTASFSFDLSDPNNPVFTAAGSLASPDQGNTNNTPRVTAEFTLDFSSAGLYHFYAKRASGSDSMFPPPDFGTLSTGSGNTNRWNGLAIGWNQLGVSGDFNENMAGSEVFFATNMFNYQVEAGDLAGTLAFLLGGREPTTYDTFVLHKTAGLSGAQLDALVPSDVVINNPIGGGAFMVPAAAKAFDADHPFAGLGNGLDGSWWNINSNNTLAMARTIANTNPTDGTFLATQIDYVRGPADGAPDGTSISAFLAPDTINITPGSTTTPSTSSNNSVWKFEGFIDIRAEHDLDDATAGIQIGFAVPSDDATNLVIGGVEVLNNDGGHGFPGGGAGPALATIEEAGVYPVEIFLTQGGGGFGLELLSSIPGTAVGNTNGLRDTLPTSVLFTNAIFFPDVNGDTNVDFLDYEVVRDNFLTGTTLATGDINGDGTVNLVDFRIIRGAINAAPAPVPEPGSLVMLALAVLGLIRIRKR